MRWDVQLSGDSQDLRELAASVNSPELTIEERSEGFFLLSNAFDALATHEAVLRLAKELVGVLNGAARLALGTRRPIEACHTTSYDSSGKAFTMISLHDTINARVSLTVGHTNESGATTTYKQADPVPKWLTAARAQPNVAKALRLLGNNYGDWPSLYRLFEVIAADVGGETSLVDKGWATSSTIARFKHTANSPEASGDSSRHGSSNKQPPAKPMPLSEAQALLASLLHAWLYEKT